MGRGPDVSDTFACSKEARGVINCGVRGCTHYPAWHPVPFLKAMNILCAGLNHQSASLELREKFAVSGHGMEEALSAVRQIDGLTGAVILSTCNRVEFYAASLCPVRAFDSLQALLYERTGVEAPLYFHDTPRSVRHLFRVAERSRLDGRGRNGDPGAGQEGLYHRSRTWRDKPPLEQTLPARLPCRKARSQYRPRSLAARHRSAQSPWSSPERSSVILPVAG